MPSKKKKYNSRFPPARIKKIMQTDEEIGKVAAAVPVLISKCLEMFLASLLTKAGDVTRSRRAKTMTRSHLKECILSETMFDFLKDHVANIPDVQNEEEPFGTFFNSSKKGLGKRDSQTHSSEGKKTPKKRAKLGHSASNNDNGDESDSTEEASENGSGNELSSQGLLSPSVKKKLTSKNSLPAEMKKEVPETSGEKPSFHIPLDALMSSEKIPAALELKKPLLIAADVDDAKDNPMQDDDTKTLTINEEKSHDVANAAGAAVCLSSPETPGTNPVSTNSHNLPAPRRGVIVANTVAYPATATVTVTPCHVPADSEGTAPNPFSPPSGYVTDGPSTSGIAHSKGALMQPRNSSNDSQTRNEPETTQRASHGETMNSPVKGLPESNLPPIVPPAQPGSMLSFLYSSVSMPISSLNMPTTVTTARTSSQETYLYNPLTQHRFPRVGAEPLRPPMPTGVSESPRQEHHKTFPNQGREFGNSTAQGELSADQVGTSSLHPASYPAYPFQAYAPNASTSYTSQRHYLGYPQSMLTPPGQPVRGVGPQYAPHPALSMVKPAPAAISDDEDYDA